jgi:hypothetical protein
MTRRKPSKRAYSVVYARRRRSISDHRPAPPADTPRLIPSQWYALAVSLLEPPAAMKRIPRKKGK